MNRKATILAVDDTSESLELLVAILTQAGFQVRPADSGALALAAVDASPPDLILLDVRMQGMDGLEVCRRLKARDRTRHIPVILLSAFADEKDWVAGLQLGAVDYITKPFRSEELLTRVKTHLALSAAGSARRLIEASLDPLVTIQPDGLISDTNAATERATGRTREELIGTEFSSYFTNPEDARAGYRQVFETGEVRDYPLQLRHSDGRVMEVVYNASVYRNEAGEVAGVFAAARDVTERKRAEELLRESEARLSTVFRTRLVGIGVNQLASGRFVEVNETFCSIFGYAREEVLGRTAHELGFLVDPKQREEIVSRLLADGRVDEFTLHVRRKAGEFRTLEVSSEVVTLAGEAHYVMVAVDVSERRKAEEESQRLFDQTLRDAKTKERLLNEINHRVKNNLVALMGLLLAEKRGAPPEGLPWVAAAVDRMSARVKGLLTTHQMLSTVEWAPLPLSDLSARLLRQCFEPGLHGGKLSFEVPTSTARVSPRQASNMALVLNELATNTLKYAVPKREHVRVSLRIEEDEEFCTLVYRDDGPGYPESVIGGEFPSVGLALVSSLVTGTLRGSVALSNSGGAVATLRIRKEDPATT